MVVCQDFGPSRNADTSLLTRGLMDFTQLDAHGLDQAAGVGPLSWPAWMADQAPLHALHPWGHSGAFRGLEAALCELGLMSGLILNPGLVSSSKSTPEADNLSHLLLIQVRGLTEVHQISSQILNFVPASNTIGPKNWCLQNVFINIYKMS